jgi:hypothetical protein
MSILSGLNKIKSYTFLLGLFNLLFFFIPGASYLFLFQNELFVSLDFNKILLLSLAINFPAILLFTSALIFNRKKKPKPTENQFFSIITVSNILAGLIMYISIISSYSLNLSPRHQFYFYFVILLTIFIYIYWDLRKNGALFE